MNFAVVERRALGVAGFGNKKVSNMIRKACLGGAFK